MNRDKALFISQHLFLTSNLESGGVQLCTNEFIRLLSEKYELIIFGIDAKSNLMYRIQYKLGINGYNKNVSSKIEIHELANLITQNSIKRIFLNHSYISFYSKVLKDIFPNIKIFLCSHGNESGDFLHQVTRYPNSLNFIARQFKKYKLGLLLSQEVELRLKYINGVLSVSEIEDSIEKWLGSKETFFTPRIFNSDFVDWIPCENRIGFISDISHEPNFIGIRNFCDCIKAKNSDRVFNIRLIGKKNDRYDFLESNYPFVKYLGYLSSEALKNEVSTWYFCLNLVDYYSKGVSTKLAFYMSFGIPVITSKPGCRGYYFPPNTGPVIMQETKDIIDYLLVNIDNNSVLENCVNEIRSSVLNFNDMQLLAKTLDF